MIVTEYCKKEETWTKYKHVHYDLTMNFLKDLVTVEEISETETIAKKIQKEKYNIGAEIEVISLGANYWKDMIEQGEKYNLLGYKELSLLNVAATMEQTGVLPTTLQAKAILEIRKNLDENGILVH